MAGKFFGIPFAATGDRSVTPNAVQPDGSVSYSEGFGFDYERANTDPAYKPVPRDGINGLYYDITDALGIVQKQGFADWTTEAQPYAINSTVRHNDINWSSEISTNNDEPGVGPGATSWRNIAVPASTPLPLGYFSGFALANDGVAPNTTISVGAGAARDSTNANNIELTSALRGILQSSGAWAAGDNQNKLDTGAKANSSTYHVFSIRKTSDGTADILFSLSASAPTIPVGYAGFSRIGRIVTDGSGNIRAFKDRGNGRFDWVTPSIEATVASAAAGTSLLTLSGMGGVGVEVRLQALALGDAATVKITASDVTDQATGVGASDYTGGVAINAGGGSATESGGSQVDAFSDTSGQVRLRTYVSAGNLGYRIIVFGWREVR